MNPSKLAEELGPTKNRILTDNKLLLFYSRNFGALCYIMIVHDVVLERTLRVKSIESPRGRLIVSVLYRWLEKSQSKERS